MILGILIGLAAAAIAGLFLHHVVAPAARREAAAKREPEVIQWIVPSEPTKAVTHG